MTIPTTYKRNTTGGAFTAAKVGGVVIGVTDGTSVVAGQPVTVTTPLTDNAISGKVRRNVVVEATGANLHAYNATKVLSGGTFAYTQNNPTHFMIRTNATQINGSASTNMLFAASAMRRDANKIRNDAIGAKSLTAWRNRGWLPLGVANQRSNWSASATGVNANGIVDALNQSYVQPADGSTTASDEAQLTGATPAELTIHEGLLTNPTDKSYAVNHLR